MMKNKKVLFFALLILLCLYFIINDKYYNNNFINSLKILLQFTIIIVGFLLFKTFNLKYITYKIKNQHIEVLSDKKESKTAAEIIYEVDQNILKLIKYLNNKYSDDKLDNELNNNIKNEKSVIIKFLKNTFIRNILKELNNTYIPNNIIENFPKQKNLFTSYNVDKGKSIYLCLRKYDDKENNEFHNFNDIMFVALHELSHNCTHSHGHNPDFWYIFRFLLENAKEINIYNPIDYNKNKFNYCSTDVTYNPLYDDKLKDENFLLKNSINIKNIK
jgi:hypothetical protein